MRRYRISGDNIVSLLHGIALSFLRSAGFKVHIYSENKILVSRDPPAFLYCEASYTGIVMHVIIMNIRIGLIITT